MIPEDPVYLNLRELQQIQVSRNYLLTRVDE